MTEIKVNNKLIGDNHPAYVVAEIGSNHNNHYDIAIEMIDKAKIAGCDAVKFQTFKADLHYSKYTPQHSKHEENIFDLIGRLEINREWHQKLKKYCDSLEIDFFTSPCDQDAINEMSILKVGLLKLASFDLTDIKLIESMAKTQIPIIMSTGLAKLSDIETAVNVCLNNNNSRIALLQCTTMYPAPVRLSNLNSMSLLKSAFNCVVGYSDHTIGDHVVLGAVAMGAKIIEKHYTLNREMSGPDHNFAIEPEELKDMVSKIRDIEQAFGDGLKNGAREEEKENLLLRRSLMANVDIKQGEVINSDNIIIKRPGYGIMPKFFNIVAGRIAKVDIKKDEWITWDKI